MTDDLDAAIHRHPAGQDADRTALLLQALLDRLTTETPPYRVRDDDVIADARARGWDAMRRKAIGLVHSARLAHEAGLDLTPPRPPVGPPCLTVVQEDQP